MKKILRMSATFALLIAVCLGFVGCKQPALEKINVDLDTIQTEYYVGESQETYENAKIYAVYDNGDKKLIDLDSEDLEFSTISTATIGTQTLTVTYKGKSQEISITIREKRVTSIDVAGIKTAYVIGETQDNTCTVTATYEDGTTETALASDVTFSTISTAEEGEQTITVTYKGVTKDVVVYVNAKAIDYIELTAGSIKTEYYYGDAVDTYENAVVTVYYADETSEVVPVNELKFSTITTTPANVSIPQILTIRYKGVSTAVIVTVRERVIESIEIVETGLKLSYDVCETVDSYDSLQIVINYTNDTSETVLVNSLVDAVVTKPTTNTTGTKALTVEYKGFEDSVTVSVTEKEVKTVALSVSDTTYIKGDEYLDNITVTLTYEDDTTRTMTTADATFADVDFGTFDITKSGYQDLTATYSDVASNTVELTVYSSSNDALDIEEFSAPHFVTTYNKNIAVDEGTQTSDELEQEFKVKPTAGTVSYYVGNLNPFKFLPVVSAYPEDGGEPTEISQFKLLYTVYKWVDTQYVELTGDIDDVVVIDDENATLNFADSVTGQFKISVVPYFDRDWASQEFEFIVADGYNVYTAEELSMFDNMNHTETDTDEIADYARYGNGAWTEFKTALGLDEYGLTGNTVKGLYLHNDINIRRDNVTSKHFYQYGDLDFPTQSDYGYEIYGSLIDYTYVYERYVALNETFTINGNYFTINTSEFPLVASHNYDNDFDKLSHASLFWTEGEGEVIFKNLKMFGNAQRAETETYAGGLIMTKVSHGSTATFDNLVTRAFFITYFSHFNADMAMQNCKSFDNFSSIIYCYDKTVNTVINSEFKRCGGPIAILAHNYGDDKDTTAYGTLVADDSTIMENYVVGTEAWFKITKQTDLAMAVKGDLQKLISSWAKDYVTNPGYVTTKNIVTEDATHDAEVMNLIAVIMDGDGPTSSNPAVYGKFSVGDSSINMLDDTTHEYMRSTEAPMFQANGETVLYTTGTDMVPPGGSAYSADAAGTKAVFDLLDDDFIGVSYANGSMRIGILLGLSETTETVSA